MLSLAGAVILGGVGLAVGHEASHSQMVPREMLSFLGCCLGAICGAEIGGSVDIVMAIKKSGPRS